MSTAEPGDTRIADLAARVATLEARVPPLQPAATPSHRETDWKLIAEFLKATTTLFLGIAGLYVTFAVTSVLEERRVAVAEGQAAEDLMLTLSKPEVGRVEAEAAALGLSAYGRAAIAPLLTQLESREPIRRQAARLGLRAVAVSQRDALCEQLGNVVTQRTGLFSWWTHYAAIQIAGAARCIRLEPALRDYAAALHGDDAVAFLERVVATPPRVNAETVGELLDALDETLDRLSEKGG